MSKPNGRQQKAIEGLAAALNECFDAAVEAGEERARKAAAIAAAEESADMKATLRMIWQQGGGEKDDHLPIDD